jgi:hypothetical protein
MMDLGALETKAGVLADQLIGAVLGDELLPVPRWHGEDVQQDLLHRVGQQAQLLGRAPSLDDVDADQRHEHPFRSGMPSDMTPAVG